MESKAEQENMNATIQDLLKMMELFQEKEKHKGQAMHEQREGILKKLQKVDTALSRDEIDDLLDNLKMTHAVKKSANRALYTNLLGYTSAKAKSRVIANAVDMAFESYRLIHSKGKNATKMNIVIMKAEVLRLARATRIEGFEDKINEWKKKQRYLEDVGVHQMDFDQKKDPVDQHLAHECDGLRHQKSGHDK